ncbi:long-chain fatty acid--CoA ligase [Micromonospora craterilacus]|uniref:Long-chain fatty acid--CoA ligase n=1 Tax=Micromonospora craterilacus TaxID=1655439 RepID=A0A2W2EXF7_9ACTN|nr:fatty acyl-AMP ligase [Micromonospora craterilacus]PZG14087.1 long-chain fatty acid--CoA ligase [Micromonospora craterilacus]
MSRFVESIVDAAARSRRGMVTGAPTTPSRRIWGQVHTAARRTAAALVESGLSGRQAIAILAGEPVDVARVVQATWLAGGSVTMLHQPTSRTELAVWVEDTVRVLRMIDARLVLLGAPFEAMAAILQERGIAYRMISDLDIDREFEIVPAAESDIALLQLTSGSTAEPKAVQISHGNLHANVSDTIAHIECGDDDVMVTWLPLFHDMGMVGCLVVPMVSGFELVSITPLEFLRRPLLWAELMTEYGGTITAAPNFAYAILARQLARTEAGSLDLSRMRIAFNGAEPIDPASVQALTTAGARFGLRPTVTNCCYGAAESALVISLSPLGDPMVLDTVDALELEKNRRAVPVGGGHVGAVRRLPLLGRAFPTVTVRVIDESGAELGDREVGRLQLRGESVTTGYLTEQGPVAARDEDGWLEIGDEGYRVDGQLVVCGRAKEVIIMAGRNIYPTDIERAAAAVDGVRDGNVAAVRMLAGDGVDRESFAVVVESRLAGNAEAERNLRDAITNRIVAEIDARPATVVVLPPGSLPKTPSGKLRRTAARSLVP